MFTRRWLEDIEEASREAKEFGAELKETPIGERKILNENEPSHEKCYKAMIVMLNGCTRDEELGNLLRTLWRKHEKDLRVVEYNAKEEETWFEECSGVSINLYYGMKNEPEPETEHKREEEQEISWRMAYHTIFHEFFHHIDAVSNTHSFSYKDMDFNSFREKYQFESDVRAKEIFDKPCQFGEIIKSDVQNLLDIENGKKAGVKLLHIITFDTEKKNKFALYDIIGAVLYRGKYGCYPDNSKYYNDNKECEYKYRCNPDSLCKPKYLNCVNRKVCDTNSADNKCVYRYRCAKDKNSYEKCELKYKCLKDNDKNHICENKSKCDHRTKKWCPKNKIAGHGKDKIGKIYWEQKWKNGFSGILAEETFAYMAAGAIVNHEAYRLMQKCLPNSEKMFREILRKMSGEAKHREYWIQCETG